MAVEYETLQDRAARLFKSGFDTFDIAGFLNIDEWLASELITRERTIRLGYLSITHSRSNVRQNPSCDITQSLKSLSFPSLVHAEKHEPGSLVSVQKEVVEIRNV